jgi:hypothetical protein
MGFAPELESTELAVRGGAETLTAALRASWVELASGYLRRWGLADPAATESAAQRLTASVLEAGAADPETIRRRIVSLARQWIENFARTALVPDADWFWLAPALLARHPSRFLATPCPRYARLEADLQVLPDPSPRPMMQQAIVDSLELVVQALRDVSERLSWTRLPEPRRLVDPIR